MRILMISDFYQPVLGGVEQHVRSLSTALAARGHQVAVATLWQPGLAEFERDGQVRVYRLRASMQRAAWLFSNAERPWAAPFPDPEITLGLRRVVGRERPDIVHGHDWLARSYLPLRRGHRARFVISLHYYTLACAKKSLLYLDDTPCTGPGFAKCLHCATVHYGAAKGIPVTLGNWAAGAAEAAAVDMFLPVSQATADGNGLPARGLPYQVLPNFVPDAADLPTGDVADYVAQLPAEPYFLFVGDLRRFKGIEVLLQAYAGLAGAPPLVLIGKVWPETPVDLPANTLVLKKWPNYAVMAAWQRSLAGIMPSIGPEPFGIVVIEALASGRPVIASRIGGMPDLVVDGETGFLVPPGDPAALRAAMARLIADPALCARMGQAGQQQAAQFRAGAVIPRFEALYADLLHRRRAPGRLPRLRARHTRAQRAGSRVGEDSL